MLGNMCVMTGHNAEHDARPKNGKFFDFLKLFKIFHLFNFIGGLSIHLNHLIASWMTNYDWPFGTLPFGLF